MNLRSSFRNYLVLVLAISLLFLAASKAGAQIVNPAKYQPDERVLVEALSRRAHDATPKTWTNDQGRSFPAVLVNVDAANATFVREKKILTVPIQAFRAADQTVIEQARKQWESDSKWLKADRKQWMADPGLLLKQLVLAVKAVPALAGSLGKGVTPSPDQATKVSLVSPIPDDLRSLTRPVMGEVVSFEMNFEALKGDKVILGQAQGLAGAISSVVSRYGRVVSTSYPNVFADIAVTTSASRLSDWRRIPRGTVVGCNAIISGVSWGEINFRRLACPVIILELSDAMPSPSQSLAGAGPAPGSTQNQSFEGLPPGPMGKQGGWSVDARPNEAAMPEVRAEAGNSFLAVLHGKAGGVYVHWDLFVGTEGRDLGRYSKVRWGAKFRAPPAAGVSNVRVQVEGMCKQWDLNGFTIDGLGRKSGWTTFRSDWEKIDRKPDAKVWFSFSGPGQGEYHIDDVFVEFQ